MKKVILIIYLVISTSLSSQTIQYYQDPTMKMGIESIITRNNLFSEMGSNRYTYPIGDINHWFKVEVTGTGSYQMIYIDEPYIDIVNLYYFNDTKWVVDRNGLQIPLRDRSTPHRLPVFRVRIPKGEKKLFYLKVFTLRTLLNTGIYIDDERSFTKQESILQPFYLIFIGSMISIIMYNLFIFLRLKERLYLYYILFGFFQLIWVVLYSGFDSYLFSNYKINHILSIGITLSSIALVIFYSKLLNLKENFPKHYTFNKYLLGYMSIMAILILINVRFYILVVLSGIPIPIYLIYISIISFKKKLNQSSYLLFGMSWYVIGLVIIAGVNLGIIPFHNVTRYLFIFGSYIEFITFSMALASRLDTLQKTLMKRDEESIEKLERIVKDRTLELREANMELKKLAIRDPLTDLYNRRYFESRFDSEWSRLSRSQNFLSCIMIDIDHFKLYNDSFGHIDGDRVLVEVSNTIKKVFGRSSDICARFGGEEFIVLLPETDINRALQLSKRFIAKLRELEIPHITQEKILTASVGSAAIIPSAIRKKEELIEAADKALYKSKEGGRNQVNCFI